MASSLALAGSAVPADRWPDGLLWPASHRFLPPCHSATFLITLVYCVPLYNPAEIIVGLMEQKSKCHFYDQTSCCPGFLCEHILRNSEVFSGLLSSLYPFLSFLEAQHHKYHRITNALVMSVCVFSALVWCVLNLLGLHYYVETFLWVL